uniref:proteoglycan 4-like n=1 Tax=Monopterus albus TaxID=43700 RepID=UPI0009B3A835|nr:proteoglycan 4-like [Monopterus albus]
MDSDSTSSDEQGKQAASSLLNVFSSFFIRDSSASSDMESAMLTSFKELSDGKSPFPEGGRATNSENQMKGSKDLLQDDVAAPSHTEQRAESLETCMNPDKQVKAVTGVSADVHLVHFTRVETHSDTETEAKENSHSSTSLSDKLARARECIPPEEGNDTMDLGEGDVLNHAAEHNVPVFRAHKFKERSRIEAILYSDRFINRKSSRTLLLSSLSKHRYPFTPKESTTKGSADVETMSAQENSNTNIGIDESDADRESEGRGHSAAASSPLKKTEGLDSIQKEATDEQRAEAEKGSEEPHVSQVSSSGLFSPKIPEVSVRLFFSPEEQLDSPVVTNLGFKKLRAGGHSAAVSPPLKETEDFDSTQKEATDEQRVEAKKESEEPHVSQVSSSGPSIPKTPEVPVGLSFSPEEQLDSPVITNLGFKKLRAGRHSAAVSPPLKETEDFDSTQKEATDEQRVEAKKESEEPHVSQVSSSGPSSPKTPEVPVGLSFSPEEQLDSPAVTNSEFNKPSPRPEEPLGDIQPSASPSSQRTAAPKTPEINTPTTVSPVFPFSTFASSSPSRGTQLSSPASFQMPVLFSGFRVLKKGAVGEDRETVAEIKQREKDADLALLSLKKTVNKAKLFPEQKAASPVKKRTEPRPVTETKSIVMGQLSHLLNLDTHDETNKSDDGQDADPQHVKTEFENGEEVAEDKTPSPETSTHTPEKKKTSDMAYETFRNIFGPKTVKKEKTEDVDLETVKRKIKSDKENLRSIFVRSSKSPSKEGKSPTEANVCNPTSFQIGTPHIS